MNLDDLKPSWQQMAAALEQQAELLQSLRDERGRGRLADTLRPLRNWQIAQVVFGVLVAGLGAQFWLPRLDTPALLVSGATVHAYGVALIVSGLRVLLKLRQVDYAAPIVAVQTQVATLESAYVLSGWLLGLPWWLLWIPFSIVFMTLGGIEYAGLHLDRWLWPNVVVGLMGIGLTCAAYRLRHRLPEPQRQRFDRLVRGHTLTRAQQCLRELRAFRSAD